MSTSPQPPAKAPKDKDLSGILYFLRVSGLAVPILCVLGLYVGYSRYGLSGSLVGVLLALAGGVLLSFGVAYFLDAVGGAAGGLLFGKKSAVWTPREQVQGLLRQARLNTDNRNFQAAFQYINQVLRKDPDYPEALLLKARILWLGLKDAPSAKRFLDKVLSLTDADPAVCSHASSLLNELSDAKKPFGSHIELRGIDVGLSKPRIPVSRRMSRIIFQDLMPKIEETPVARWAAGITVVFAFLWLLTAAMLNLQLDRLDSAGHIALRSVQRVHRETLENDLRIRQAETLLQQVVSPVAGSGQKKAP